MRNSYFLTAASVWILFTFFSVSSLGANITYIGDSQSAAPYGVFKNLEGLFAESGHQFSTTRAVCGATIDDYSSVPKRGRCKFKGVTNLSNSKFGTGPGQTEKISSLMTSQTDVVVVQLGDNHLGQSEKVVSKKVISLASQILKKGKKCIWIGPTQAPGRKCEKRDAQKKEVARIIKKTLAGLQVNGKNCKFIDSYALTAGKPISVSRDCLHYRSGGYKTWAKSISGRILSEINKGQEAVITDKTDGSVDD